MKNSEKLQALGEARDIINAAKREITGPVVLVLRPIFAAFLLLIGLQIGRISKLDGDAEWKALIPKPLKIALILAVVGSFVYFEVMQ